MEDNNQRLQTPELVSGFQKEENTYYFPYGLPGFETLHYFKLIELEDNTLAQLVSMEDKETGFVVIRPGSVFPEYLSRIEIDSESAEGLKMNEEQDIDVWAILTLNHSDVTKSTLNLRAPILINGKEKIGAQIILNDDRLDSRVQLFQDNAPEKAEEGAVG